jgi:hypothetical protein
MTRNVLLIEKALLQTHVDKTIGSQNSAQACIVVHICNHRTRKAEAGGSKVQGQPERHSKTLSFKKKKKNQPRKSTAEIQLAHNA